MEQIEENCSGKVILIGCGPLDEAYVSQIGEPGKGNMSSEEAEEFDEILRHLEEGFGEKDESLRRRKLPDCGNPESCWKGLGEFPVRWH